MKKVFVLVFVSLVFFGSTVSLSFVNAAASSTQAQIAEQLQAAAGEKGAGFGEAQDPRVTVVNIIRTALEFIGIIFIVLTLYAGFLWMTAGGNEEKVTKSKTLLFQATIGLAIIVSAYSITLMVAKIVFGRWTDYENIQYIEQRGTIQCNGLSCP